VKLNLHHPDVRAHLFGAVRQWITDYGIDGLRLDVADHLDPGFLRDLAAFCRRERPDFWLLGEVLHGDYRRWANPLTLDSVTNYECYKGLYSSHNDRNYFEIAYALDRQFGERGLYRDLPLYAFVDNHDVSRIASTLRNPAHLYPLHALLFTMPGVPAIYYGSEWGLRGVKRRSDDWPLRPHLVLADAPRRAPHPDLAVAVARFARIRHETAALRRGTYRQLYVAHEQFAFERRHGEECVVVAVNAAATAARLELDVSFGDGREFVDLLDPSRRFAVRKRRLCIDSIPPCWARILALR
jgi:cyclomaltodextrinase